uniref:allantoate deiminase n=1 Tax=Wollemia nobilis TaxID=56998 RepID=A0A0C9S7V2_9CONI
MGCSFHVMLSVLSVVVIIAAAFLPEWNVQETGLQLHLFSHILREEAVFRIGQLSKISDSEKYLERTFLSHAAKKAGNLIEEWMWDAGLKTWVDQMGNVHGRTDGANASAPALLIGSHLDTVVDAGKYDGSLGIICALAAIKALKMSGKLEKLPRPVEVIAFSDEEGVRFHSTFLGSAAIAGILPVDILHVSDKSGVTLQDALKGNNYEGTGESLLQLKYDPLSVWGYIEVHIEQGPVLEAHGIPLGVVLGIAGQTRLKVTLKGSQGHAGTVPMSMRKDPMPAAAEAIVILEKLCKYPEEHLSEEYKGFRKGVSDGSIVCTVGEIATWPSASNVIPGQVTFTVDIRAKEDDTRELIISEFNNRVHQTCDKRSVSCSIERKHDASAVECHRDMNFQLQNAARIAMQNLPLLHMCKALDVVPTLMSGAGHDAMAISHITKVGMLFVRCTGGISHSPAEHVLEDDIWAASLALLAFVQEM